MDDIVRRVSESGRRAVEVTGGEPLAQAATPELLRRLGDAGLTVLLETCGALSTEPVDERVHVILDFKTPSSGEVARNDYGNAARLRRERDEVKFVIGNRADFDWSVAKVRELELCKRTRAVLFSPVFGRLNYGELAAWIMESGRPIRLQLQLHKLLGPMSGRGRAKQRPANAAHAAHAAHTAAATDARGDLSAARPVEHRREDVPSR